MKQISLASSGLSMSQAQSISNLCNQRAGEIGNKLKSVNNYTKTVKVGEVEHVTVKGNSIPKDVVQLIKEKSTLHACQAFLMENLKAKDEMLSHTRTISPDLSKIDEVVAPRYVKAVLLSPVDETFGWEKLSVSDNFEYLEAEAHASHVGQFIHKNSPLDKLRTELPEIPAIEWMSIKDGEKSPVVIKIHDTHTSEGLLKIHEELAAIHREHEQKVNYFKAKVKNLTTNENARIANENANVEAEAEEINKDLRTKYDLEKKEYSAKVQNIRVEFEKTRQGTMKNVAALRIEINPRFQDVIDGFLKKLPEIKE